jgi:hypothetical protein
MPTFQLYPFRFRDPLTGKWVRARHKLQVPEMQRCYAEWDIRPRLSVYLSLSKVAPRTSKEDRAASRPSRDCPQCRTPESSSTPTKGGRLLLSGSRHRTALRP